MRKSDIDWIDAASFAFVSVLILLFIFAMVMFIIASNGWAAIPIAILIGLPFVFKYTPLGDKVMSWL